MLQLSGCIYDAGIMFRFNTSNHKCGRMFCNIEMLALFFALTTDCPHTIGLFALSFKRIFVSLHFNVLFILRLNYMIESHAFVLSIRLNALRMFDFSRRVFLL